MFVAALLLGVVVERLRGLPLLSGDFMPAVLVSILGTVNVVLSDPLLALAHLVLPFSVIIVGTRFGWAPWTLLRCEVK